MSVSKEEKKYCSVCGKQLIKKLSGAEKVEIYVPEIDNYLSLAGKFDTKTGKRNMVDKYVCPKKRWFNSHDEIYSNKIILKET